MNHQPHQTHQPDELIDRILHSLRDTRVPANIESRIAARLAMRQERRLMVEPQTSTFAAFFAAVLNAVKDPRIPLTSTPLYALAATTLAVIISIALLHRHQSPTFTAINHSPQASDTGNPSQSPTLERDRTHQHPRSLYQALPQTAQAPAPPTDADTIALAETLAPSHPAPPMSVTQQEALLLRATQPGQPIEVAELDSLREPALRAIAQRREHANVDQYIHALLGPLAAAESIAPTPPPPDETQHPPVDESPLFQ